METKLVQKRRNSWLSNETKCELEKLKLVEAGENATIRVTLDVADPRGSATPTAPFLQRLASYVFQDDSSPSLAYSKHDQELMREANDNGRHEKPMLCSEMLNELIRVGMNIRYVSEHYHLPPGLKCLVVATGTVDAIKTCANELWFVKGMRVEKSNGIFLSLGFSKQHSNAS